MQLVVDLKFTVLVAVFEVWYRMMPKSGERQAIVGVEHQTESMVILMVEVVDHARSTGDCSET